MLLQKFESDSNLNAANVTKIHMTIGSSQYFKSLENYYHDRKIKKGGQSKLVYRAFTDAFIVSDRWKLN